MVGLGDGPPCLRVDSEEILLTLTDERAQLARTAPGITPVDSSEKGAPVRELIWPSVLGEPLSDCLQELMSGERSLKYAIRATASVWMPFEQVYSVESGDVDFDSFGMAPWDAGGMNSQTLGEPYRTKMLQWLIRLLCRPVIMNRLIRTRTMYTENGLDTNMMIPTDFPRLTVTPGEWYGNDVFTQIRHELRDARDNSAAVDCKAVIRNNLISRRLCLPPEEVSAGRDETDDFPETDCATAESDAADMNDLISHRLCLPPEEVSAGLDGTDDFPETDCAAADSGAADMNDLIFHQLSLPPDDDSASVDYDTGAVGLDDLIFRRLSFSPEEFAGGRNTAADAMKFAVMIFRRTKLPADEFSDGRNGDYLWRDLGTEPSVCNRPVTGSYGFGSSHRLGQCCLWFAALHFHRIENAEVPLSHHLLLVVLCHIHLRDAFKALFPPCFRLFLTFSYCLYDFLREQELGTGGSPITDRTACFHEQSKRAKWNIFAPDFEDTIGTVDFQASRELGEGDMRLRTTRLLSSIRSGYPRREIGKDFQNRFYLSQ